ncbi:NAD-dependent epimerase/dehydratase family protein [Muricoccus aerilatus]|uniref:NAD-dependent epimerase/dehydratase family protein n=1 Tax=Muricoccus aerilatus TaxID=452982 RepID=UPI000A00C7E4|nr:NAD-dependent epimerase/dehydratase family protein [Roseomonas aerilata]
MATYLLTGGCGFIGSHLSEALLARGDKVRVLDDLSTGKRENLPQGVTLIEADVADAAAVRAAMEGVDGCFHLAAIASVERGVRELLATHRVNLSGTLAVFDAASPRRLPVVYASSAAAYGDAGPLPLDEATYPRPLSAYGADKLGCEQHARAAGQVHRLPTCGLRFFNVFGPRQDPASPYSGVISIFCNRLSRGEPVDLYGDGEQTRDFIFVADVVAALLAAMDKASPEAPVLNVCTGRPTSVRALAETIGSILGMGPELRNKPPRLGEIRHSLGNRARAVETLGLGEPVALRDGLAATLEWMRTGTVPPPYLSSQATSQAMAAQSRTEAPTMMSVASGQPSRSTDIASRPTMSAADGTPGTSSSAATVLGLAP